VGGKSLTGSRAQRSRRGRAESIR